MGSKTILFFCLLAVVAMVASEVAAKDLATENTNAAEKTNGVEESKNHGGAYGGVYGRKYGRGGGGYGGGRGGGGGYGGGGGGYGHGGGGYGHGGGGYGGGGRGCHCCGHKYCGCCSHAGQAVDAEPESKPKN